MSVRLLRFRAKILKMMWIFRIWALLQQPSILILDEATSAVDSQQEHKLMTVIDKLFANKTRLIVSHREQPIQDADYLLTIVDGTIEFRSGVKQ